jgi:hypothetical protein
MLRRYQTRPHAGEAESGLRLGSSAQTCKRPDHCRGRDAAVTPSGFVPYALFKYVEVELAVRDDALGGSARVDRSEGFDEPLVMGAVRTATDGIFRTTIGTLEPGVHQELPEPRPDVGARDAAEKLIEDFHQPVSQRRRRPAAMDDGKIVLMKDGQTSLVKQGRTVSQDGKGILRVNEDVTADDRVELTTWLPSVNVRLDAFDVAHPFSGRASPERCQCVRIDIDGRHAAGGPDQPAGEQRDVANATADIEHLHPGRKSGTMKELLGQRIQYRGLKTEAPPLPIVVPHHVGRGV